MCACGFVETIFFRRFCFVLIGDTSLKFHCDEESWRHINFQSLLEIVRLNVSNDCFVFVFVSLFFSLYVCHRNVSFPPSQFIFRDQMTIKLVEFNEMEYDDMDWK